MQKNLIRSTVVLSLVTTLVFASCQINKDEKDILVDIQPEYTVDLFEKLGRTYKDFRLKIHSTEAFDCLNYDIPFTLNKTGTSFSLNLAAAVPPADCIVGTGLASKEVSLTTFPFKRKYDIELNLRNTVFNKGTLEINDDVYLLELKTEDGLDVINHELRRIPENTVWGYLGFKTKDAVGTIPEEFFGDLETIAHTTEFIPGYYGYFSILSNQKVFFPEVLNFSQLETFQCHLDSEVNSLRELVETFRANTDPGLVEIQVFTWLGEEF